MREGRKAGMWGEGSEGGSMTVEQPSTEFDGRRTSAILSPMDVFEPDTEAIEMTAVLQALGDPVRLEIVRVLAAQGEQACGVIPLDVSKATRSHHFKVLREAGLTRTRIEGTHRLVTLRSDDLEARLPGLLEAVLQRQPV